ncbi:MAG: hypothetical protein ABI305_01775 [Tepidiformaceae bacterium]
MADAKIDGVQMLPYLPFLISTNSFGIIAVLIFMGTSLIFMIPVFATRGGTQMIWFGLIGFVLTLEGVGLIALVILVNNGTIWQS